MKQIEVTRLESIVLNALADCMYAEYGFSDAGFPEVYKSIKHDHKDFQMNTLKGVSSSLHKKGLIWIDRREDEGHKNNPNMWIWYLHGTQYLVEDWQDEAEPIELIIKE